MDEHSIGVDLASGESWSVELLMRKTADGNYVADISGLSEEDKRILIESLKRQAGPNGD